MDPVTVIAGSLAVVFALLALMQWRRAEDLESRVRELEAKLTETLPAPKDVLPAPPPEETAAPHEPERAQAEPARDEAESAAEQESDAVDDADEAEEQESAEDESEEDEPADDEAEAEPAEDDAEEEEETPAPAAIEAPIAAAPVAKPAEPDLLRLEALKVVAEAFELARYLDFDAIVEKPSTYRVTVPLTAANANAVRYLEDGMFNCLKEVRLEDASAILHIDTSKGPP